MYKVFFNDNKIILTSNEKEGVKSFPYDSKALFEMAIFLMNQSKNPVELNIHHPNLEHLWAEFCSFFKEIHAAGGIVKNKKDKILFIYRLGKWDLPKGKVEKGEDYRQAALREVEEECGIEGMEIEDFYCITYHIYYLKNQYCLKSTHWYKMNYCGNQKLVPQTEEGIEKVKWVKKDKIPNLLKDTYLNIKELFI